MNVYMKLLSSADTFIDLSASIFSGAVSAAAHRRR